MHLNARVKPLLYCIAGFTFAIHSAYTGATPVYLLLEGAITGSIEEQSCTYCTWTDRNVGKAVQIVATWDDQKIFGNDVNTDPTKGQYGGTGSIGTQHYQTKWFNPSTYEFIPASEPKPNDGLWLEWYEPIYGAHYSPLSATYSWETDTSWQQYFVTIDGVTSIVKLTGDTSFWCTGASCPAGRDGGWKIDLTTENSSVLGDLATLSYQSNSYNIPGSKKFTFSLQDASQSALDQQLFGFNWDISKGGTATGSISDNYQSSGGQGGSVTNNIAWSRAVLTYNPADLAAVPIPSTAWLFGSSLLGLAGASRRKFKIQ